MAISHADHDHPNTPAARAKCRKTLGQDAPTKPATWNVKPSAKSTATANRLKARAEAGGLAGVAKKKNGTLIKNVSDMADVPHALAHGIHEAWARDLDVRVGDRFRDDEARVVIQAELGEIALVWKVTNVHGVNAIWVRNWDSSKAFKVQSIAEAFTVTADRDMWDEFGNLRTA